MSVNKFIKINFNIERDIIVELIDAGKILGLVRRNHISIDDARHNSLDFLSRAQKSLSLLAKTEHYTVINNNVEKFDEEEILKIFNIISDIKVDLRKYNIHNRKKRMIAWRLINTAITEAKKLAKFDLRQIE
jgi:hypothetical protein